MTSSVRQVVPPKVRAEKNTVPELPAAPGSLPRDEVVGKTQVMFIIMYIPINQTYTL